MVLYKDGAMDKRYNSSTTRVEKMDSLVQRMTDGLGSNKYRAVDYDRLRAELSEKRFGSVKTSMKLAKLEKKSQQHKENTIVNQHQLMWQKEFLRLHHLRRKAEADREKHMRSNRDSEICGQIYKDFDYYDARLSCDFDSFRKATSGPLWSLRDDLRYWLVENLEDMKLGSPDTVKKHADIKSVIAGVKDQQHDVMKKLCQEQRRLEAELQTGELMVMFPPALLKHTMVSTGIPQEAIDLKCPDFNLKSNVLREFIIIDEKYESTIEEMQHKYALALSLDEFGGWDPDEHFKFVFIHDQYPVELPNQRTLLLDRLKRHFPNRSLRDLLEHEEWWKDFKYYHERLKVVYADWARHKLELINKAQIVFAEASVAYELEEVRNEYYQNQKQLCDVLYEKVMEWRNRKMEAMQLEAQLDEERRKQMKAIEEHEKEAEKRRRSKEKENISHYHELKEEEHKKRKHIAEQRLQELKKQMEEQAIYDRERIKFREEQLSNKLEEQRQKQKERVKENEEMELRLEALRAQVRVIAESDPARIVQGTKAWEAHHKLEDNEEMNMLMPLFKVHGYTSNQITSDHRVRLEEKLREAGLHTTEYGRQVIRAATPPKPPRRDLKHNFRFRDQ
ncbi:hypothetical protein BsWGS_04672 [Bradybaena similaris]